LTAKEIVPDEVIGEPVTVNSEEPESATATEVTVPVNDGCTCENTILTLPIDPLLSVVQRKILSAFELPS